jgi:hypothetical protein
MVQHILWDDVKDVSLLESIIYFKAYAPDWGKSEEIWEKTNIGFFNDNVNRDIKHLYVEKTSIEKLKKRYKALMKEIAADEEFKKINTSDHGEDDMPRKFWLYKQIQCELDGDDEENEKKKKKEDKKRLDTFETTIIDPTKEPVARKIKKIEYKTDGKGIRHYTV